MLAHDAEGLLEDVIARAGVLVCVLDEAGHFVRFNRECERLSGWRAEEMLGRSPWDTVLPQDLAPELRGDVFNAAVGQQAPGPAMRHCIEWVARSGARRRIEWTSALLAAPHDSGRFRVVIGVDVTDLQAAETALRRSAHQLQQTLQVADFGLWELDMRTRALTWSGRIVGLESGQHIPDYEALLDRLHADERAAFEKAVHQAADGSDPVVLEHRIRLPDGQLKWVLSHLARDPTQAETGPPRLIGWMHDLSERRRLQAQLCWFRQLVEHGAQEVWITDADRRITYVNQLGAQSLGYAPEQLEGRSVLEIDAGGGASVSAAQARCQAQIDAGGGARSFSVQHRHRYGHIVPKQIQHTRLQFDGEWFNACYASDISEQLRTLERLALSESLLQAAMDAFPGWVVCVDDELRYRYVNMAHAKFLKQDKASLLGRTVAEVRGHAFALQASRINAQLLNGEAVYRERRFVNEQGEERIIWVQYGVNADPIHPGRHLFYAFGLDITASTHAEMRMNAMADRLAIAVWEWNTVSSGLWVNTQLFLLLGIPLDDPPQGPADWARACLHPHDRRLRKRLMAEVLAGEREAFEFEFRARHQDGRWLWLLERGRVAAWTEQGQPRLVIGLIQDISKLKANELELQRLNEELELRVQDRTHELEAARALAEQASAAKSEFLSSMSHELRTPMNAIFGFSQLLQLTPLAPEAREHVDQIMLACQQLTGLVSEILDLAKVEAGRMEMSIEALDVAPIIDACLALLRVDAERAQLKLVSRVQPGACWVAADAGRLRQVLLNLLSNAIKFNRQASHVWVDCLGCDDASMCELVVTDQGPGLTAEQLARLFQPFERLDAPRRAIPGTGIGLSLSKRLVELMRGSIGVRSQLGQGSSFWFRLPVAVVAGGAAAGEHEPGLIQPGRATGTVRRSVLYVEDNLANQRLMEKILQLRPDLALTCTTDPATALAIASREAPSVVLLDLFLPGANGLDLMRQMRDAGMCMPIIAVSASAMPDDVRRGLAAGFSRYLTKPLNVARVLETLDQLLASAEAPPVRNDGWAPHGAGPLLSRT